MSRKSARENAFKIIYSCALMKEPPDDICAYFEETVREDNDLWAEDEMSASDKDYMRAVVFGTAEKKDELNEKIAPLLKKWDIGRLPKVDLAILQLAVYEIEYLDDVPDRVSVNEAVEIAKKYGENDSYKYINGVLAQFVKGDKNA